MKRASRTLPSWPRMPCSLGKVRELHKPGCRRRRRRARWTEVRGGGGCAWGDGGSGGAGGRGRYTKRSGGWKWEAYLEEQAQGTAQREGARTGPRIVPVLSGECNCRVKYVCELLCPLFPPDDTPLPARAYQNGADTPPHTHTQTRDNTEQIDEPAHPGVVRSHTRTRDGDGRCLGGLRPSEVVHQTCPGSC